MAASSVTGSFRGIEVSFTYDGPHIVMSVLNKAEEGRHLRVMFQQQPLSGRVNWASFQLTGQAQDVVVPTQVIQSHKLAFYVDNHEPISTYTEKILEELKLIQHQQMLDNQSNGVPDQTYGQENGSHEAATENETDVMTEPSNQQAADAGMSQQPTSGTDDVLPELEEAVSLDLQDTSANLNGDENRSSQLENVPGEKEQPEKSEAAPTQPKDESVSTSKRKTQYIGQYLPQFAPELQFKIKVPSFPKSASKKQATFDPPGNVPASKSNDKKDGFFGQLAGTFGFSSSKKKEYYVQQNRHLYEKFHANLEKMESDYNNGYGIPLDNWDFESLSEREIAILLLNLMVNEVSEWKKAAKKEDATKETLAKSLETIEGELKQTLKQTRGIMAPAPTLFPDRTASTDNDLVNIQKDCDFYLQRFSKKLANLEQKHADKVKISAFKKFLVEFVRDKLFPSVAEFSSLNTVQSRLDWFLGLVDYELMPIELGKTKFSPEHHKLKEKRSSEFESDTIVEVVSPGLQSKDGKRVIQNAVVVQAE